MATAWWRDVVVTVVMAGGEGCASGHDGDTPSFLVCVYIYIYIYV